MEIIEIILAFIVLVGILVFVHELGHFLTARWTGMRADVFAVGMGPRLFGWNRQTGFTFGKLPENLDLKGGTDYRISAFPIGGYVKIVGMVDESMDSDFATRAPQPYEFRSKGTPAKILVISAGVIMNFLFAIGLFAGLAYFQGKDYQATTVLGFMRPDNPALKAGLLEGDRITAVNGMPVQYFEDINRTLKENGVSRDLTVAAERNGVANTVVIPASDLADSTFSLVPQNISVVVKDVNDDGPAATAGLLANDTIVAANGMRLSSNRDLVYTIKGSTGAPIALDIKRGGQMFQKQVTPDEKKQIKVTLEDAYSGPVKHEDYSLGGALQYGFDATAAGTAGTFGLVGKLVTGQAKLNESVGGPGMIATIGAQAARQGLPEFLTLMAALSVTLACMNILPIPALDGGHLVFIIIEAIIRREVSLKVRMAVQQVGVALLLIFMIFVFYNDGVRLFGS